MNFWQNFGKNPERIKKGCSSETITYWNYWYAWQDSNLRPTD